MKVFSFFATLLLFSVNGFAAAPVDGPNYRCNDGSTLELTRNDSVHTTGKVNFKGGESGLILLYEGKIVVQNKGQVGTFTADGDNKLTLVFFDIATLECVKVD